MIDIDLKKAELFEEKILAYFDDEEIVEIFISAFSPMHIIKKTSDYFLSHEFSDSYEFIKLMQLFSLKQGLRLDPNSPSAGGMLKNYQFRWHCVIPPATPSGAIFSIRKHQFDSIRLEHFLDPQGVLGQIKSIVKSGEHLLICGETGSGKTTMLASILNMFFHNRRVAILETLNELPSTHAGWFKLLEHKADVNGHGNIKLDQLMMEALRLRPDSIVIGELRGIEASGFIDAITTGHQNIMSTIHGRSVKEIKERLQLLLIKSGYSDLYARKVLQVLQGVNVLILERGEAPIISGLFKL